MYSRIVKGVLAEKGSAYDLQNLRTRLIDKLRYGYKLSYKDVAALLEKTEKTLKKEDILIPISAFKNKELSAFETICKYLKEELNLSYHEIAILLSRDDRTIWASYDKAVKKRKQRLSIKKSKTNIPHSIFKDRKLSVLETLVTYLRDTFNLRYSQIATLLNRDERNIWTVYNRAKKKNG